VTSKSDHDRFYGNNTLAPGTGVPVFRYRVQKAVNCDSYPSRCVVTASSKYKAAVGNAEVGILFGANVRSEEKRYE
jgi:hypothetical protein